MKVRYTSDKNGSILKTLNTVCQKKINASGIFWIFKTGFFETKFFESCFNKNSDRLDSVLSELKSTNKKKLSYF